MTARLVNAEAAARALGVKQATIRQWVRRGKLKRSGTGPNHTALFAIDDLMQLQHTQDAASA